MVDQELTVRLSSTVFKGMVLFILEVLDLELIFNKQADLKKTVLKQS